MNDLIDNWLTTQEAIAQSGYSEAGLRKLRAAHKIKFRFIGRMVLYWREDVEALANKRLLREERKREVRRKD